MIFLYGLLFVAVVLLIIYVYGLVVDLQRKVDTLRSEKMVIQSSIVNCLDWIDDVAKLDPLEALKEVQCKSTARNAE